MVEKTSTAKLLPDSGMACVLDPPTYWRDQVRLLLSCGGEVAALDPLLQISGPPDVPLKDVSEGLRSALVKSANPNFRAHFWQTRMWNCVRIGVKSLPNIPEAKTFAGNNPGTKLASCQVCGETAVCPNCRQLVSYKVPGKIIGRVVTPGIVRTYQRRIRAACQALALPLITEPIHLYVRPGNTPSYDSTFFAWRLLAGKYEITTDSRMDLDNLIKALGDGLQGERGTPGLLMNDRFIHLLSIGRIHPLVDVSL